MGTAECTYVQIGQPIWSVLALLRIRAQPGLFPIKSSQQTKEQQYDRPKVVRHVVFEIQLKQSAQMAAPFDATFSEHCCRTLSPFDFLIRLVLRLLGKRVRSVLQSPESRGRRIQLMSKPDVEPLCPGVLRGREVVRSLEVAQRVPFAFFVLIPLNVI